MPRSMPVTTRAAQAARAASLSLLLSIPVAFAAINLDDFDTNLMRDMDDAHEDLEPALGAANAAAAREDLAVLKENYDLTLEYFTARKDEAPDAVEFAAAGLKLLGEIGKATSDRNFERAVLKARELNANCKGCHEKYRPKKP
jgi:cytochrome c556